MGMRGIGLSFEFFFSFQDILDWEMWREKLSAFYFCTLKYYGRVSVPYLRGVFWGFFSLF